jgi:predicted tellurium resistance membrane protein TerC
MEWIADPTVWVGLLTLVALEIVRPLAGGGADRGVT